MHNGGAVLLGSQKRCIKETDIFTFTYSIVVFCERFLYPPNQPNNSKYGLSMS